MLELKTAYEIAEKNLKWSEKAYNEYLASPKTSNTEIADKTNACYLEQIDYNKLCKYLIIKAGKEK